MSPLLNKSNRSLREKTPNPQRLCCKEVCIYISIIYAFVLTTNMCLETQEKISHRVHPLQPLKDYRLDHPVSWKSLTCLLLHGVIFNLPSLNSSQHSAKT